MAFLSRLFANMIIRALVFVLGISRSILNYATFLQT